MNFNWQPQKSQSSAFYIGKERKPFQSSLFVFSLFIGQKKQNTKSCRRIYPLYIIPGKKKKIVGGRERSVYNSLGTSSGVLLTADERLFTSRVHLYFSLSACLCVCVCMNTTLFFFFFFFLVLIPVCTARPTVGFGNQFAAFDCNRLLHRVECWTQRVSNRLL